MTAWLAAIASVAAVWLALALGLRVVAFYKRSQNDYVEAAHIFFEIAEALTELDDLPADLLTLIENMNFGINDRHSATIIAYVMQRKNRAAAAEMTENSSQYLERYPSVALALHRLYASWFTAVTAHSPIMGAFARIATTQSRIPPAVKETVRRIDHKRVAHA